MKKRSAAKPVTRQAKPKYAFRLYITGGRSCSTKALTNLKDICEKTLQGRYEVEVVDIYQQPELAHGQQIIAAPTLVKHFPLRLREFIGDLSETERILIEIKV